MNSALKRVSSAGVVCSTDDTGAAQRGDEDRGGLRAELVERAVAVLAHAEVDLRGRGEAVPLDDVDQESELDAPALDERQRLEDVAAARVLTRASGCTKRASWGNSVEISGRAISSVTRPPPLGASCSGRR